MSREIKFRIGHSGNNGFRGFTYIYVTDNLFSSNNGHGGYQNTFVSSIDQFTGLKDKNLIDIYEWDYLVDYYPVDEEDESLGMHESLMPVVWCDKQLMWCVDVSFAKDGSCLNSLVYYFGEFLEVRGNIYENPELLNQ